jgi:hypothetical protein
MRRGLPGSQGLCILTSELFLKAAGESRKITGVDQVGKAIENAWAALASGESRPRGTRNLFCMAHVFFSLSGVPSG